MVQKRDGRLVPFDKQFIINAVLKAFKAVTGEVNEYAETKAINIANYIEAEYLYPEEHDMTVEEIQDLVEQGLCAIKDKRIAKAYILYREERNRKRLQQDKLTKAIGEKLTASNVQNQNANVDEYSFGGRKGEASNVYNKNYALNYIMSPMSRNNHLNNEIYIHDLDSYPVGMHNCSSIPFDDLLANGFVTRQTDVRPAASVNTAFQLVAVIFQLQSLQQFGGCAATHLDWTMVPYVRKSFYKHFTNGMQYILNLDLSEPLDIKRCITDPYYNREEWAPAYTYAMDTTVKELNQAVEGMFHNLNTLQSRSGN